jgi:uncharacterized protein DUF4382
MARDTMSGKLSTIRLLFLGIGILVLFTSCPPAPGKGILEIRVKDHRAAIDDFARLEVPVESIRLKPRGSWIVLKPEPASFDLTLYKNGNSVTLFKGEIESGSFEGFHLKLGKIGGTLKKEKSPVEVNNGVGPIQLSFSVEPNKLTLLIIDLELLDLTDHMGRGYELHINGYEYNKDGKLIDKVPPGTRAVPP